MNMFSQALILLVSGILIITGRINFGVFFSIGNFASTLFTELGVVVNQYTVLQSSKTLNAKLRKRLAKQTGQAEQRESLDHFQALSAHGLSVAFSNKKLSIQIFKSITSAIDAHNGLEILRNLLQTDATIVFIAHNLTEEMRQLFDREIHLNNVAVGDF